MPSGQRLGLPYVGNFIFDVRDALEDALRDQGRCQEACQAKEERKDVSQTSHNLIGRVRLPRLYRWVRSWLSGNLLQWIAERIHLASPVI